MRVVIPSDSALPIKLANLLEEASNPNDVETVIESLTHYFSYVELRCKTKKGNKLRILADTDIYNLTDQDGDIIPLEALVNDICKSIKVVDLYGDLIFKVKF